MKISLTKSPKIVAVLADTGQGLFLQTGENEGSYWDGKRSSDTHYRTLDEVPFSGAYSGRRRIYEGDTITITF